MGFRTQRYGPDETTCRGGSQIPGVPRPTVPKTHRHEKYKTIPMPMTAKAYQAAGVGSTPRWLTISQGTYAPRPRYDDGEDEVAKRKAHRSQPFLAWRSVPAASTIPTVLLAASVPSPRTLNDGCTCWYQLRRATATLTRLVFSPPVGARGRLRTWSRSR